MTRLAAVAVAVAVSACAGGGGLRAEWVELWDGTTPAQRDDLCDTLRDDPDVYADGGALAATMDDAPGFFRWVADEKC